MLNEMTDGMCDLGNQTWLAGKSHQCRVVSCSWENPVMSDFPVLLDDWRLSHIYLAMVSKIGVQGVFSANKKP
jgi:hypothetical protein